MSFMLPWYIYSLILMHQYERNANLSHIKTAHAFFILYIVILLPESLTPARMRVAQEKYAHQQSLREEAAGSSPRSYFHAIIKSWHPLQPLAILFPTSPGSSSRLRTNLVVLAICDTLFFGTGIGGLTVSIMYAEMMFKWGNYEVRSSDIWVAGITFNLQYKSVLDLSLIRQFHSSNYAFCGSASSGQNCELEMEAQGNQCTTSSPTH